MKLSLGAPNIITTNIISFIVIFYFLNVKKASAFAEAF